MKRKKNIKLFEPKLVKESIAESFVKLNPKDDDEKPGDVYC